MSSTTDLEAQYCADNDFLLPEDAGRGEGVFVLDCNGERALYAPGHCPVAACRNEAASNRVPRFVSESKDA